MAELAQARKYLQWLPLLLVAFASVSANAVQGYQVNELLGRVSTLEKEQVQQIRLEERTKNIKEDVEKLDEKIDRILDALRRR